MSTPVGRLTAAAATTSAGRSRLPPALARCPATSDRNGSAAVVALGQRSLHPEQRLLEAGKSQLVDDVHLSGQ